MMAINTKIEEVAGMLGEKTGQNPKYIGMGIRGTAILILFFTIGGGIISKLVGYFYPAFESFKALETARGVDDRKWLTYWVVFGLLTLIEHPLYSVLSMVPFYFFIKMLFLVWLYLPMTDGAQVIYEKWVQPAFKEYEGEIDGAFNKAKESVIHKEDKDE
jgi:receptor expression-enhancing protein 5/6